MEFQSLFGYRVAVNQCLSCNVTEAQQTSVPAGVKQSQNNPTTDTAGGPYNPRIGRAAGTALPGKWKYEIQTTLHLFVWVAQLKCRHSSWFAITWVVELQSPTCTRCCWRCCSCREQSGSLIPGRRRRKSVWQHPATPDTQSHTRKR